MCKCMSPTSEIRDKMFEVTKEARARRRRPKVKKRIASKGKYDRAHSVHSNAMPPRGKPRWR